MKTFIAHVISSVLSAVYWWIVFTIVYADVLFAGDRNPAAQPPSDDAAIARNVIVLLVGILIYAGFLTLWSRLGARQRRT